MVSPPVLHLFSTAYCSALRPVMASPETSETPLFARLERHSRRSGKPMSSGAWHPIRRDGREVSFVRQDIADVCRILAALSRRTAANVVRSIALIPVYNEEATIRPVLDQALCLADVVIAVNDGSSDGTADLLAAWQQTDGRAIVLAHADNRGMAGALQTGFRFILEQWAQGHFEADDIVVTLDGDGQHLPAEIPLGVERLRDGPYDVVLGRRDLSGYPWLKQLGNRLLSWWAGLLSGYPYQDVECGFRWMRLRVLADVYPLMSGRRYGCAQELGVLTAGRGWRVDNTLPTTVAFYRKGARIRDGATNAWCGLIAWRRSRRRPLTPSEPSPGPLGAPRRAPSAP
jgi:hypothetical protein